MQKQLPRGWRKSKLGEIITCLDGQRKPINEYERQSRIGNVPYYGANGQVGWIDDFLFDQKLLLVAEDGGNWDAFKESSFIIEGKSWVNNHAHVLAENGKALLEFLNFYLFSADLKIHITGTTRGKLNKQSLMKIPIPLPPLPTQHKIVEILEEADSLRKLRKQADDNMQTLILALFTDMFGDPNTNPKEWEMKKIRDVCLRDTGTVNPTLKKEGFFEYIDISMIDNISGVITNSRLTANIDAPSRARKVVKTNDVIVSTVRPNLNAVAIVPAKLNDQVCSTGFCVLRSSKISNHHYIYAFARSRYFIEKLIAKTKGANYPAVSDNDIFDLLMPLPPLPMQQEFAKRAEEIEAERSRQAESKAKLDELFNSLMQRAFTGELVA